MSYQVLARKWRPQTFQEVIGQPHVLTALENGLTQNRVHHAYLFSGTRGVGKTSIARLLAKSLNCETGVTATPCGQCANCEAIDQGRFVDLLEIDAASRTKVDDTRELLDNVQYKPAQGRYKVYLIDEVHMLSKHSFNALLKTLEEPPEYVKFLLATTDPQKLPVTVLSRCLQFHLKAILPEQIEEQLVAILTHEQATFEQPALTVIAKAADGSMRDALSLTDQALAFGAGHIEYASVLKMLGTIDQSHLHYLLHFVASGNSQKVFEKIQEFVHLGADFSALHQELASLCHQIALAQLQLNANVTNKTAVQLLAERLTPEEVQLFYQIALEGYKDYTFAPNGKVALEMTVMRLLAFKPANYVDVDEAMLDNAKQVENVAPVIANESTNGASHSKITTAKEQQNIANDSVAIEPVEKLADKVLPVHENQTQFVDTVVAVDKPQVPVQEEPQSIANLPENGASTGHLENESQPENTELNAQVNTPSLESSNSRNMLRSHRLKREALKKTEATTDNVLDKNEQFVAPEKSELVTGSLVEPVLITPREITSESLTDSNVVLPEKVERNSYDIEPKAPLNHNDAQELPPLSSYQEQPPQQEYVEGYGDTNSNTNGYAINQVNSPEQRKSSPQATVVDQPIVEPQVESKPEPKQNADISDLKQSEHASTEVMLIDNGSFQSPEIDITNYVEGKMTDPWFLAIQAMQLVGFEKLLAKNTVMQINGQHIVLTLYEAQQHLLNNHALCEALTTKVYHYYGQQYAVNIEAGKVEGHHTPVELEVIIYQQYLDEAKSSIKSDAIVQTFVREYAAKVYENSVVPL